MREVFGALWSVLCAFQSDEGGSWIEISKGGSMWMAVCAKAVDGTV